MYNLNISDNKNNLAWEKIQSELVADNFQFYWMIVYRDQDKSLLESLRDEQTWAELHEISGESILVFAFKDRAYTIRKEPPNSDNQHLGYMSALPSSLHTGNYAQTSTSIEYSKLIKGFTGEKIKIEKPFLFLFCNKTKNCIALELSTFTNKDDYSYYLKKTFKFLISSLDSYLDLKYVETNWIQGGGNSILNRTSFHSIITQPKKFIELLKMFIS